MLLSAGWHFTTIQKCKYWYCIICGMQCGVDVWGRGILYRIIDDFTKNFNDDEVEYSHYNV